MKLKKKVPNNDIICRKAKLSNWEKASKLLLEKGKKDKIYSVNPIDKGYIKTDLALQIFL